MNLENDGQTDRPAKWPKKRALYSFRKPRAILGIVLIAMAWLTGCSSLAGVQPRGIEASDDELLAILSNLARRERH